MFIKKVILLAAIAGQIACSIEKENPVQKEIDYKLRIHKTGQNVSLRSADMPSVDLRDRLLFYKSGEAFPTLSEEAVDNYKNENIDYIDVESSCRVEDKEFYQKFRLREAKFYFYQIVKEELLLWPYSKLNCDFVFQPHFVSGSTNSVQKSFLVSANHAKTHPDLGKKEYNFTSMSLADKENLDYKKICLNHNKELINSTILLEEELVQQAIACRYWIKENNKVLISELFIKKDIPLLQWGFLSASVDNLKRYSAQISLQNLSAKNIKLRLPAFIYSQRVLAGNYNAYTAGTIAYYPLKVAQISVEHKKSASYYTINLAAHSTFTFQVSNNNKLPVLGIGNNYLGKYLASDINLKNNCVQVSLDDSEKYYTIKPQVNNGVVQNTIKGSSFPRIAKNILKGEQGTNCQAAK